MKWHEVIAQRRPTEEPVSLTADRAGSRFVATALARSHIPGKNQKSQIKCLTLQWIDALAESSSVLAIPRRSLRDQFLVNELSCLERGSAATRTVVWSISLISGSDELTHISRINRR